MERIVDDPFSVCKGRSGISSPIANLKVRAETLASPASSSDSSLSQTAGVTGSAGETGMNPSAVSSTANISRDRSPHGSKGT